MKRKVVYFIISLIVSAAILAYLFSRISIGEVLELVRSADHKGIALFLLCSLTMSFFRTWRYALLLSISGFFPKKLALFLVVLVRNLCSDLLPARIGTLAFVALATTRLGVPAAAALSAWAYSLIFDLLALAPLVVLATLYVGSGSALSPKVLLIASLLWIGLTVAAIYLLLPTLSFAKRTIVRFLANKNLISITQTENLLKRIQSFEAQIELVQKSGNFLRILCLSMGVRVGKYSALYFFLYALLKPMGYDFAQLNFGVVFLGLCAAELAASLPISGIAGFGAYQGAWVLVFQLLGFPARIAQVTSLAHHIFTQVYGYLLGIAALLILYLPNFRYAKAESDSQPAVTSPSKFYIQFALSCLAAIAIQFALLESSAFSNSPAKPETKSVSASSTEVLAVKELAKSLPAKVVFDSNRSGTFGIYTLTLESGIIEKVVDNDKQEMHPDPSNDGRYITYDSALSLQRNAPSDIWIFDRQTKNSRLLSEDGEFPTFSSDSKYIYFVREENKVIRYDLQNAKEDLIFPIQSKKFSRKKIAMPRISADGKWLAFTSDLPQRWTAWRVNLESEEALKIGHGCEAGWYSEQSQVLWVSTQAARERSGIFAIDAQNNQRVELVDQDAPWGHEYFPSTAISDQFLLYAACGAGQHSHTDANYQLFAKELKSNKITRLTFDGFTNRWPKALR